MLPDGEHTRVRRNYEVFGQRDNVGTRKEKVAKISSHNKNMTYSVHITFSNAYLAPDIYFVSEVKIVLTGFVKGTMLSYGALDNTKQVLHYRTW